MSKIIKICQCFTELFKKTTGTVFLRHHSCIYCIQSAVWTFTFLDQELILCHYLSCSSCWSDPFQKCLRLRFKSYQDECQCQKWIYIVHSRSKPLMRWRDCSSSKLCVNWQRVCFLMWCHTFRMAAITSFHFTKKPKAPSFQIGLG